MEKTNPTTAYSQRYQQSELYWGSSPSLLCYEVLKLHPPQKRLKVLDLGCGEGKDALFFARNGYEVTAVDLSDVGLRKLTERAEKIDVEIRVEQADINTFRVAEPYDVIFSSGTLQYLKPHVRKDLVENLKAHTRPDGVHALHTFVGKPFLQKAPDAEDSEALWTSGELMTHYHDWWIEWSVEEIKACNSSGVPHWHAHNRIIARKRGLRVEG